MATTFETRYASSPQAVKKYDTQELRDEFLVPDFEPEICSDSTNIYEVAL